MTFSVSYFIELLNLGTFCRKSHLNRTSGSKVMSNWRILKTIENKRNSFLFLALSHNQCSRLPNYSSRSQHIWCWIHCIFISECPLQIMQKNVMWSVKTRNMSQKVKLQNKENIHHNSYIFPYFLWPLNISNFWCQYQRRSK